MNYGIIYATGSNTVRRMVSSDEVNYDFSKHICSGESLVIADNKNRSDLLAARIAVQTATGKPSLDLICAVVDKSNNVVSIVSADPKLDQILNHTLLLAPAGVSAGCTYDPVGLVFIVPAVVIPAGLDKQGNTVPQQVIPSKTIPIVTVVVPV